MRKGNTLRLPIRVRLLRSIPLGAQSHCSLRTNGHVHDLGASDNIDRLVRVLGYVIAAMSVMLDEHMVQGVTQCLLYTLLFSGLLG